MGKGGVGKDGGKAKPLKQAKKGPKEYDEDDMAFLEKKKQEAKDLAALKAKAGEKGAFGGKGLAYSGKK